MDHDSNIQEGLTAFVLALYLILFIYIYVQLVKVLFYGHKKWCFRTAVLYLCIVWTGLRITLFAYYWYAKHLSESHDFPEISQHVGTIAYFLLFTLPLYLQFTALCLFVGYFSKILSISEHIYQQNNICSVSRRKAIIIGSNIFVLVVNIVCAILIKEQNNLVTPIAVDEDLPHFPNFIKYLIIVRVVVNAVMFIVFSVILGLLIRKVSKTEEARLLLETENITQSGAVSVGIVLAGLYTLRTLANILALIPTVDWVYDTDQVDLLSNKDHGYYMFLGVLLLWEYLPTLASVVFFRVKRPQAINYICPVHHESDHIEEEPLCVDFDSCSLTFDQECDGSPLFLQAGHGLTSQTDPSTQFQYSSSDQVYA